MNRNQIELLMKRFIFEPQKYKGFEPEVVKKINDLNFCKNFF